MKFIILILGLLSFANLSSADRDSSVYLKVDTVIPYGSGADVLFVVDDSGSMSANQENLKNHIGYFTQELDAIATEGRTFHIGVTTTSVKANTSQYSVAPNGQLYNGYVSTNSSGWQDKLRQNLLVGVGGSADEMATDAIFLALQPNINLGFRRPNTPLYLVLVTDEPAQAGMKHVDLVSFLMKQVPTSDDLGVTGFFGLQKSCSNTANSIGEDLSNLVSLLNGKVHDLCDKANLATAVGDLGASIVAISSDGIPGYRTRVPLFGDIDLSTLKVQFAGKTLLLGDIQNGFGFDSETNEIVFGKKVDFSTQPNEQIHIEYVLENF